MALHAEVNAFTCPGKWLYIKNKIQVNILFWLSMIFNCWFSYAFVRVPPENLFPISPPEKFETAWRFVPNTEIPLPPQWIPLLVFQVFPPLYIIIMCPLGPPFFLLFKVCSKTCLSLSPLHLNLYFYEKNFLIYLPCIGKSRTFAPAFQERESRLKLTCCKCVLIALTDHQNNLLFLWSLILKFVIFAVRFAIKGVYSGAFPFC